MYMCLLHAWLACSCAGTPQSQTRGCSWQNTSSRPCFALAISSEFPSCYRTPFSLPETSKSNVDPNLRLSPSPGAQPHPQVEQCWGLSHWQPQSCFCSLQSPPSAWPSAPILWTQPCGRLGWIVLCGFSAGRHRTLPLLPPFTLAAGGEQQDLIKFWWRWTLCPSLQTCPCLTPNLHQWSQKRFVSPSVIFTCHLLMEAFPHTQAFSTLWVHWRISFLFLCVLHTWKLHVFSQPLSSCVTLPPC